MERDWDMDNGKTMGRSGFKDAGAGQAKGRGGSGAGRRRARWAWPILGLAALIMLGAGLWGGLWPGRAEAAGPSPAQEMTSQGDIVRHPAAELADGQARYFSYKTPEGTLVRYFLVQDGRGKVRAALDACEVCWRAGLGYEQQGDVMVCRNCGRRFATVQVGEQRGGCNPVPLETKIEQGQVLVKAKDLQEGRPYFDLASSRRRERNP
jgi:hypothetical protein